MESRVGFQCRVDVCLSTLSWRRVLNIGIPIEFPLWKWRCLSNVDSTSDFHYHSSSWDLFTRPIPLPARTQSRHCSWESGLWSLVKHVVSTFCFEIQLNVSLTYASPQSRAINFVSGMCLGLFLSGITLENKCPDFHF